MYMYSLWPFHVSSRPEIHASKSCRGPNAIEAMASIVPCRGLGICWKWSHKFTHFAMELLLGLKHSKAIGKGQVAWALWRTNISGLHFSTLPVVALFNFVIACMVSSTLMINWKPIQNLFSLTNLPKIHATFLYFWLPRFPLCTADSVVFHAESFLKCTEFSLVVKTLFKAPDLHVCILLCVNIFLS